jgi:hypothetical protein
MSYEILIGFLEIIFRHLFDSSVLSPVLVLEILSFFHCGACNVGNAAVIVRLQGLCGF